jgi:bifunctional N-acetylglucosamine-1-phosphate-uridyltransferase/glucosamine-1-phosphate-acetyltransferase GlmU-like protein
VTGNRASRVHTSLVAPLTVGAGAYTAAAGSVADGEL